MANGLKIEVGKRYKTDSGREVRVYATDGYGDYPIHGAIFFDDSDEVVGWQNDSWMKDGKYTPTSVSLNIKEEIK